MGMIASILRIIKENVDVKITQSQKDSTFDSYLTEILAIESSKDNTGEVRSPDNNASPQPVNVPSTNGKQNAKHVKDSTEPDSDPDDDKPSKKPKLNESDLPWHEPSDCSSTGYSNPSCKETCRLLRIYNCNIAKAKFLVKISPRLPPGIPSSEFLPMGANPQRRLSRS